MIRKKPAPYMIRGGNRVSGKIMLIKTKALSRFSPGGLRHREGSTSAFCRIEWHLWPRNAEARCLRGNPVRAHCAPQNTVSFIASFLGETKYDRCDIRLEPSPAAAPGRYLNRRGRRAGFAARAGAS